MSDLNVFQRPIIENGMKFYVFPQGYPLFKARKGIEPTAFRHGIPSFFGIKHMSPEYIESYEEQYGIIFEYVTTRPYKLVALDDRSTQERLRREAPEEIQKIIDENYGFKTNYRDSVSEKDRMLARYLCEKGYEGYATQPMATESGGTFHIELVICDAVDGIQFVRRVTDDSTVSKIMEKARFKRLGKESEEKRKLSKKYNKMSSFEEDEAFAITPARRNVLFGPDSPPSSPPRRGSLFGGKSKKKRNKRTRNKTTYINSKRKTYRRKLRK